MGHYTCMQCCTSHLQTVQENILSHIILGVITPNQIPLTTIVTHIFKNVTEAEFQTTGPLYLHAVWNIPFTNSPRKHTVTYHFRCHYTKSNPIDDHSNIYLSKKLQKQNFKPLGHYTCMQCGTSHLQTVQENILSHIILATYRKFTVATIRFTQNVSCNIYTHPRYQQVANVTV